MPIKFNIDHLFWILLFLYSDPGGYQEGYFGFNVIGPINFGDLFFFTLFNLYLISNKKFVSPINKRFDLAIIIWLIYFIFVFGIMLNETSSPVFFMIKMRRAFYAIGFFIFTRHFFLRNSHLFLKYLIFFSSVVFVLFFITLATGFELIPLRLASRGFIDSTRYYLYSYSLMGWLIPISIVIMVFKIKIKERRLLLFYGGLMLLMMVVSLTRRHFVYTFFYILTIIYLANRLKSMRFINLKRLLPIIIIPLLLSWMFFPTYINATQESIFETWSIVKTGETTAGSVDQRLSITQQSFLIDKVKDNFFMGSGFDYLWFTGEGDKLGFEGRDYQFLSGIAQLGIVGLLFFVPIYFLVFRLIFSTLKRMRTEGTDILFGNKYDLISFLFLASTFLIQLIDYPNYFSPASFGVRSFEFYVSLGLFVGILNKVNYRTA